MIKNIALLALLLSLIFQPFSAKSDDKKYAIVLHGGAGYMTPENLTSEQQMAYKKSLTFALNEGITILKNGGTSEEAVIKVITILENDTLFNAGRGAVLTSQGNISHDASIMSGQDQNSGAIAGTSHIKNPILAAAEVKNNSVHVFLSGEGAETFAQKQNLEMVEENYFILPRRLDQLKEIHAQDSLKTGYIMDPAVGNGKFGTVGCVALDQYGNICAGTSTGGMMNKKYGRIGDSPCVGAGTYADNATCGISATGHGEYFIRVGVAKEISDQMKFGNKTIFEAANYTIYTSLDQLGGKGGIIAIDKNGNIVMSFNTPGMFRAWASNSTTEQVAIFKD